MEIVKWISQAPGGERTRFWGNAMRLGARPAVAVFGAVSLVTGVAAVAIFSLSPWLILVIALVLVLIALAEGSFRIHRDTSQRVIEATAEKETALALRDEAVTARGEAIVQLEALMRQVASTGPVALEVVGSTNITVGEILTSGMPGMRATSSSGVDVGSLDVGGAVPPLIRVDGKTFRDENVSLSGYEYVSCTFINVTFLVPDAARFALHGAHAHGTVKFSISDPMIRALLQLMADFNVITRAIPSESLSSEGEPTTGQLGEDRQIDVEGDSIESADSEQE